MTVNGTTRLSGRRAPSSFLLPVLPVAILFVGAALRSRSLGKRDLWVDEAASVFIAKLPWPEFWHSLWDYQGNMSFYYLLLRGWLNLGDSVVVVRSLSVLFGVGTIAAIYSLGKNLFGRNAALIAAALSALNFFQLRYSQEARAYSLVMLLAVLSTHLFVQALRSPGRTRYWIAYVLITSLGIYSHLYMYLVVGAQWLVLGYRPGRSLQPRLLLLSLLGFIVLTLPFDLFILRTHGELTWVPAPTPEIVLSFAMLLTGNGGKPLLAAYAFACLYLLWHAHSRIPRDGGDFDERWCAKLVATWLLFPIAATLAVSLFKPIFYDRYMAVCAPALSLLAGHGIACLAKASPRLRHIAAALLLMMLGLSAWGIRRYDVSFASSGDHWKEAVAHIVHNQQPGDATFFYRPSGYWPFRYYVDHLQDSGPNLSPSVIFPLDLVNPEQDVTQEQAFDALRGHDRVWLVLQHYENLRSRKDSLQEIEAALAGYHTVERSTYPSATGPINVVLYARNTP